MSKTMYQQPVNPANRMPEIPDHRVHHDAPKGLSTERQISSIPRAARKGEAGSGAPPPCCPMHMEEDVSPTKDAVKEAAGPPRGCPMHRNNEEESSVAPEAPGSHVSGPADVAGGASGKWVYPSAQQFYNALRLRGKELPPSQYMDAVIFAHNVTNERTWEEIGKWEAIRGCSSPSLVRFEGKYDQVTLKGRVNTWLAKSLNGDLLDGSASELASLTVKFSGDEDKALETAWQNRDGVRRLFSREIFDRHDWLVDSCGRGEVRYVIDYYDDQMSKTKDGNNVTLDVRPAPMDSPFALLERAKVRIGSFFGVYPDIERGW